MQYQGQDLESLEMNETHVLAGWSEVAGRLKYRPVITGYFHMKKHNFDRLLLVKIIELNPDVCEM